MAAGDNGETNDGASSRSIFSDESDKDEIHRKNGLFYDEGVWLPHSHFGTVSMMQKDPDNPESAHNRVQNSNGSQFMINLRDRNGFFDEHFVLFGRIISGWDLVEKIMQVPRKAEKPEEPVIITNSGELRFDDKLNAEKVDGKWQHPLEFLNNYDRNVFEEDEKEKIRREAKRKVRAEQMRKWEEEQEKLKETQTE